MNDDKKSFKRSSGGIPLVMTDEDCDEWAIRWLKSRGYRVQAPLPPRKELSNSIRLTDYDPETGELLNERYIQSRDPQGRPE